MSVKCTNSASESCKGKNCFHFGNSTPWIYDIKCAWYKIILEQLNNKNMQKEADRILLPSMGLITK